MSTFKSFKEIESWRRARELSKEIFELTCTGTFCKDFGLKDQINRASGSIMDNIAEGFDRGGTREFLQFLSYSRGSCSEVQSQLVRALDRKYLSDDVFQTLDEKTLKVSKMITGLMFYLRKTELKGFKFNKNTNE